MRWNNPLGDPDELSEVTQFLGFSTPVEMITKYLAEHGDITQFARFVDDSLISQQQAAAAVAMDTLEDAEVNGIPLFHFKEGTLQSIIQNLIGLTNGRTVANSQSIQSTSTRAPRRTLSGFKLDGVFVKCDSFSEMLLDVVNRLSKLPDAITKLDSVNGAISIDKSRLNPNGKITQVGTGGASLFVDTKKSADQLEELAMKCVAQFGQTLEVVT